MVGSLVIVSSQSTRHNLKWGVTIQFMVMVGVIHQVAGAATLEEIGPLDKMIASSVVVLGTGPEIAPQQLVAVVSVQYHPHNLGLVVVETAMELTVIVTWMIDMIEDVMETGSVLTAEMTVMRAGGVGMLATGILLVETDFWPIGLEVQTAFLKMGMGKTEAMTGMKVLEVVVTDMELEGQRAMKEEATETGQVLMTALGGEDGPLPLIVIEI